MSLNAHRSALEKATRELSLQWEHTRDSWRDEQAREFERQYVREVRAGVERAAPVIEELDKLITRIRSECE